MLFPREKREEVVAKIREEMATFYAGLPDPKGPISHFCLFWAGFTVRVLKCFGVNALLQGGTAFWDIVPDGEKAEYNEWGYLFEWSRQALVEVTSGLLPEMHVWAVIPGKDFEILDLTTGFWKKRCESDGHKWRAPEPPDYLWLPVKKVRGCRYLGDKIATQIAQQMWSNVVEGSDCIMLKLR